MPESMHGYAQLAQRLAAGSTLVPESMHGYAQLAQRLAAGSTLVLDGAIGTELERLGAPMHGEIWCGEVLRSHPELVREVHRAYLDAGAEVITTNTYATTPYALRRAGLGEHVGDWNRRAVQLAREARDQFAPRPVCIAGSVSTFNIRAAETAELTPTFAEHGRLLVDAGVDLLLLETLGAPPAVIRAALDSLVGLGVPVWLALSCLHHRETGELVSGVDESPQHDEQWRAFEPFARTVEDLADRGAAALLMMHSEFNVSDAAVDCLRAHTTVPVGAYPNAGYWQPPNWTFVDQVSPDDFAAAALGWRERGAQILGGCCGIGVDHIRALRAALE